MFREKQETGEFLTLKGLSFEPENWKIGVQFL